MKTPQPYVFLDRDGTLVRDTSYPYLREDYETLPEVIPGLLMLQDAGFHLAIITNQSGIGRGLYTESDFDRFQSWLLEDLVGSGVIIDATYHCPHTPEAGCSCRKPETALLNRAVAELNAHLPSSWVIGDQDSDIELAERAGCRGAVRIGTSSNEGGTSVLRAQNLRDAAMQIRSAT